MLKIWSYSSTIEGWIKRTKNEFLLLTVESCWLLTKIDDWLALDDVDDGLIEEIWMIVESWRRNLDDERWMGLNCNLILYRYVFEIEGCYHIYKFATVSFYAWIKWVAENDSPILNLFFSQLNSPPSFERGLLITKLSSDVKPIYYLDKTFNRTI